ncbi:MAG: hypothetical protein J6J60_01585 [Clostridia bacterium]|nr:hypothetical protein [Clostridia bacterium]
MQITHNFTIGFTDIDKSNKVTNKAILNFLENTAGIHSSLVGQGLKDIPKTNTTWLLLAWKLNLLERPEYNDTIQIKTWSKNHDKLYAYRNFEILNSDNEIIGVASSKWLCVNPSDLKIIKLTDEILEKYESENISVLEDENNYKLNAPNEYLNKCEYKITKNMLDMYNHVHNTFYLDFVEEVLPEECFMKEFSELEIMYKKQILGNENVKVFYSKQEEEHYIVIKSEDENTLHAIIKMK